MTDVQIVELSRWHWRAAWLAMRKRWDALHPTDREALALVAQFGGVLLFYMPGVLYALP